MNSTTLRPYVIGAVLVAAWTAVGWIFRLGPVTYSLIGMPFVVAFQLLICRRPIHQIWVRDAQIFRLDRIGILLAIVITILHACLFGQFLLPWRPWGALFLLILIVGAVGVGFALGQQHADRLRRALPSFAIAVVIGLGFTALLSHLGMISKPSPALGLSSLLPLLENFVRILPATFICDEVVFRGFLDSYIAPSPGTRREEWVSAIYVSALWGLWHMWRFSPQELLPYATRFLSIVILGVPFSFCWRKGGTLLLPGVAHALIDAYRDTN